jgi:hypothetical protein
MFALATSRPADSLMSPEGARQDRRPIERRPEPSGAPSGLSRVLGWSLGVVLAWDCGGHCPAVFHGAARKSAGGRRGVGGESPIRTEPAPGRPQCRIAYHRLILAAGAAGKVAGCRRGEIDCRRDGGSSSYQRARSRWSVRGSASVRCSSLFGSVLALFEITADGSLRLFLELSIPSKEVGFPSEEDSR